MLGKLLKYDIKSMAHTFVPLFIAMLGMSILNILFFQNEWIAALIGGSAIMAGLLIALLVTTIVMIITQFYHSVLGDQGYLTNTLPVSVDTILFFQDDLRYGVDYPQRHHCCAQWFYPAGRQRSQH